MACYELMPTYEGLPKHFLPLVVDNGVCGMGLLSRTFEEHSFSSHQNNFAPNMEAAGASNTLVSYLNICTALESRRPGLEEPNSV
jgi:hypothetical protein